MSPELRVAIASLEGEVRALEGAKEDSIDWFELQAKSLGLSLLRNAAAQGTSVDVLRKKVRKLLVEPSEENVASGS